MRLPKLQNSDKGAKKIKAEELSKDQKDIKEILYY